MVIVVVCDEYLSGVLCNVFNSQRPSRRAAGSQKALLEYSFFLNMQIFRGGLTERLWSLGDGAFYLDPAEEVLLSFLIKKIVITL